MSDDDVVDVELDRLREMAAGCGWTLAELAEFYAPRARAEVEAVDAARRAGDAATVARLAHGAKGSSASLGLRSLSLRYRRIEAHPPGDDEQLGALICDVRAHVERVLAALQRIARHPA